MTTTTDARCPECGHGGGDGCSLTVELETGTVCCRECEEEWTPAQLRAAVERQRAAWDGLLAWLDGHPAVAKGV